MEVHPSWAPLSKGECVADVSVWTRRCESFTSSRSCNNKELQFPWMTLKIKMTDQREPVQPDFPFQDQTSRLVSDRSCVCVGGGGSLQYMNQAWSFGHVGELKNISWNTKWQQVDKVVIHTAETSLTFHLNKRSEDYSHPFIKSFLRYKY